MYSVEQMYYTTLCEVYRVIPLTEREMQLLRYNVEP